MSNPLDFKFVAPRVVGLPRSKFDLSHSIKTTWNVGELMIIDVIDIIPGDTLDLDVNMVARSITPVSPTMDNAFMDIFAFWVPNRLTYFPALGATETKKTWEKINGENPDDFWAAKTDKREATKFSKESLELTTTGFIKFSSRKNLFQIRE